MLPGAQKTSNYTRGWGALGHSLHMWRSSLVWQMAISLLIGCALGSWSFASSLGEQRTRLLPRYINAHAINQVKKVLLPLGQASQAEPNTAKMRASYQGRTPGFLFKQWAMRAGALSFVTLILTSMLATAYGRRVMQDRRLRGASIADMRQPPSRVGLYLTMLVLGAFFFATIKASRHERLGTLEYGWSVLAQASPSVAAFASPDGQKRHGWYDFPLKAGFYEHADANRYLQGLFGRGFASVILGWVMKTLFYAALAACWAGLGIAAYKWAKHKKRLTTPPLHLGGVAIPVTQETAHFLMCGSPGAGKSEAIKNMLDQVRARKQRAIVYDVSGEYIEKYYRAGQDCILNPFDARCEPWHPWAEVGYENFTSIARSLFPPTGSREAFWHEAGGELFAWTAAQLYNMGTASNGTLHRTLTQGTLEDLAKLLDGTPAARLLDPKAGSMPPNLLATTTLKVAPFAMLPDTKLHAPSFSIHDFIRGDGDDRWLFLACREDQRAACKPLLSLWCDIAARAILSLPVDLKRRLWLILDEVASLQHLPSLPDLLERGRKHGACAVLGLQCMPQLRDAYGSDKASALMCMPQTWLVLRTVEPDTARWLENALGHTEIDMPQTSVSMGASGARDGMSIQQNLRQRAVALASEIMTLPDMHGYLRGQGMVHRISYDYRTRPSIAPFFVPRTGRQAKAAGQ